MDANKAMEILEKFVGYKIERSFYQDCEVTVCDDIGKITTARRKSLGDAVIALVDKLREEG